MESQSGLPGQTKIFVITTMQLQRRYTENPGLCLLRLDRGRGSLYPRTACRLKIASPRRQRLRGISLAGGGLLLLVGQRHAAISSSRPNQIPDQKPQTAPERHDAPDPIKMHRRLVRSANSTAPGRLVSARSGVYRRR